MDPMILLMMVVTSLGSTCFALLILRLIWSKDVWVVYWPWVTPMAIVAVGLLGCAGCGVWTLIRELGR